MTIAIGDVVRFSAIGKAEEQMIVNTSHWLCGGLGINVSELLVLPDLGNSLQDTWQSQILPFLNNGYTIDDGVIQRVSPTISATFPTPVTIGQITNGGRPGDQCPNTDAMVMSIKSGLPGRRHRGRMYLGPVSEGDVSGSTMSDLFRSQVRAGFVAWTSPLNGANFGQWSFGIFSRKPPPGWVAHAPGQTICRAVLGTIRRRRLGRGK